MGCISWADGCNIIGLTPLRETTPMPIEVVSQERRQQANLAALTSSYTTHQPGVGLDVCAAIPASVASAPRGGVACNDAAIRQEGPILGWVRDARVRSQQKHTLTVNDERM